MSTATEPKGPVNIEIAVNRDGTVTWNGEPTTIEVVMERLQARRLERRQERPEQHHNITTAGSEWARPHTREETARDLAKANDDGSVSPGFNDTNDDTSA